MNAEGMATADVERMENVGLGQTRSARVAGAGNRGGGGQSAGLTEMPQGWTGTPEAWLALSPRQRQSAISQLGTRAPRRGAGAEGESQGVEIVPGVFATVDSVGAVDARQMRQGIATAQAQAANLRGLGQIHEEFGGLGTRISPEAQQRIRPRLVTARGMVAELGRTGVINPGEVGTINAALPDPNSLAQMTFGTFNSALQEWQQMLEENVRAQLGGAGVDDTGVQRVIGALRTGSWSQGGGAQRGAPRAQPAPQGDRIVVVSPDGRQRLRVSREREAAAVADGWTVER
jgi:hypothetical protein